MRSGQEAAAYASELRRIMRFIGTSDGNMQVCWRKYHSPSSLCGLPPGVRGCCCVESGIWDIASWHLLLQGVCAFFKAFVVILPQASCHLHRVHRWLAELSCVIPSPQPLTSMVHL